MSQNSSNSSKDEQPADFFLDDSDIESQMDDFKIQDNSDKDSSVEHDERLESEIQIKPLKFKSNASNFGDNYG